uniref:Uncharacterized protein n=1 Tax=Cacopsylla melanoneura TaxID=428564 RepID=A0A8D8UB12_9HEMI
MAEGTIVFTSLCLFALLLSVCARPNDPFITFRHADTAPVEDESLPNEDPATLNEEVLHNTKNPTYNEDELEGESNPLSRRQTETAQEASETTTSDAVNDAQNQVNEESTQTIDAGFNGQLPPLPAGLGPQGFNGQLPPMPPNMGPQQIQQLREFLSLEVNNKDKFGEIFARMTPEQVKKIREIVLQVGQQTGNQELIRFGQCQSPQFDQKAIQVLLGLGQATYDRLNAGTTGAVDFLTRSGPNNIASNVDQRQVFDQIKRQIGAEQDFIRRLVNMIELQLSRAPQIDNEEFAEIKQITARIKQLSGQVQSQLQQATDMSQLSQLGNTLLEIQRLSSKIQQKISAELLEEKMKELSNASSIADQTTTTSANNDGSADNAAVQVQTTETK